MKPELRSHKNIVYELSKSESGYSFFISTLKIKSDAFKEKSDAIHEAQKQIEISKIKKVFGNG